MHNLFDKPAIKGPSEKLLPDESFRKICLNSLQIFDEYWVIFVNLIDDISDIFVEDSLYG